MALTILGRAAACRICSSPDVTLVYNYDQYCDEHRPPLPQSAEEFYVCDQHMRTGGYESCCGCSGDRECTEAIQ